jgi:glycosyltransferase involved in cell wall biosynthesis
MVSIIVPTYNRANIIRKSIDSILSQTYGDFELIIVDDGSTDDTKIVVDSYKDKRIRYIRNDSSSHGPSVARNIGIQNSKGEYIAFNDSDDIWHGDKLEKQISFLHDKNADITFCTMHKINDGQLIPNNRFSQGKCTIENILKGSFTGTPALLGKSGCFKNNLFDQKISCNEDWELVIRLLDKYKVFYQNENLVEVSSTEKSVSSDCDNAVKAMKYIYKKHAHLYSRYKKSKKRIEKSIIYQKALANDMRLCIEIKNRKSVRNYAILLKNRIIRYAYAVYFLIEG